MKYTKDYFDQYLERRGSDCFKWDGLKEKFGIKNTEEIIPMWIADMDFKAPQEVIDTIIEKAKSEAYGYTIKTEKFYDAIINWVDRHYNWKIKKEWIIFTPGVIPGFNIAVQKFTQPGEGVIVQTPVYYPFMEAAKNNGRILVENPLLEKNGDWFMDFEDLEKKLKDPKNKVMILCNPHNPVGRAWKKEELKKLSDLCIENNVILISDEIHADLMMSKQKHNSICGTYKEMEEYTITHYAPSKTFNIAGLQTSYAIIPNPKIREAFVEQLNANRISSMNWFGGPALITAYTKCDEYVEALCSYVSSNMDYMKEFIDKKIPVLKMKKPEATYMVWVDFRGTGMNTKEIEAFIIDKAHIAVDMGSWFGTGGDGYLRFNLACPRSILEKALNQLEKAFKN